MSALLAIVLWLFGAFWFMAAGYMLTTPSERPLTDRERFGWGFCIALGTALHMAAHWIATH